MTNYWEVLQFRVTTFHSGVRTQLEEPVLARVLGMEPETIEVKPKELRRLEAGRLGPGLATYGSAGNRVDWIWQVSTDDEPALVTLGEPEAVADQFLPKVMAWLAEQKDVVRIALGGQFGHAVGTREEAYNELDLLIQELEIDAAATSELTYQINRPKTESVADLELKINYIEKWNCLQFWRTRVAVALDVARTVDPQRSIVATFACCELDMNTSSDFSSVIEPTRLAAFLDHLRDQQQRFLKEKIPS